LTIALTNSDRFYRELLNVNDYIASKIETPFPVTLHTEVFINQNGELILLEIANRPGGALIVPMYEKQLGINSMNLELQLLSGETIKQAETIEPASQQGSAFWLYVPKKPGEVKHLTNITANIPLEVTPYVQPGESLKDPISFRDKAFSLLGWDSAFEKVNSEFERLSCIEYFDTVISSNVVLF